MIRIEPIHFPKIKKMGFIELFNEYIYLRRTIKEYDGEPSYYYLDDYGNDILTKYPNKVYGFVMDNGFSYCCDETKNMIISPDNIIIDFKMIEHGTDS